MRRLERPHVSALLNDLDMKEFIQSTRDSFRCQQIRSGARSRHRSLDLRKPSCPSLLFHRAQESCIQFLYNS